MTRPHVFEAQHLQAPAVLIFGKGPTFDPCVIPPEPCKVYAINQTAVPLRYAHVEPDLVVCCDLEPMYDIQARVTGQFSTLRRFKALAAPVYPHQDEAPVRRRFNYDELLDTFENIYLFDMFTAPFADFEYLDLPTFYPRTSYNVALRIAWHWGVRQVFTNGVDGGAGRHAAFKDTHQLNVPNYDAQFEMQRSMEEEGIRFERLKL